MSTKFTITDETTPDIADGEALLTSASYKWTLPENDLKHIERNRPNIAIELQIKGMQANPTHRNFIVTNTHINA